MEQRQSPPPPKAARLSDAELVTTALAPPVALGLGLGLGPCGGSGGGRPAFTFLQLQELQHQALIYKYMAAGVPVPLQLVLPIWKSVAGSSPSSSSSSFRGHYPLPSFMGCVGGGLCFDYGSGMDPEPGRCRRTDGKKWRCSRDAVPNQKYCHRHMHRGRHRSRKHVESGGGGGGAAPPTAPPQAAMPEPTTTTNLSVAIPTGLQLMPAGAGSMTSSGSASSPHRLGLSPISALQLRARAT